MIELGFWWAENWTQSKLRKFVFFTKIENSDFPVYSDEYQTASQDAHISGEQQNIALAPLRGSPWHVTRLVNTFPALYGIQRFITALTTARHHTVFNQTHSTAFSSYPNPILPNVLLSSGMLITAQINSQPQMPSTCSAHLTPLNSVFLVVFCGNLQSKSSSLRTFLYTPARIISQCLHPAACWSPCRVLTLQFMTKYY